MNNIDFTNFLNSMIASVTTTQMLTILTSVIGVGMIFFLMWLGVRWLTSSFTKAVETGRISTFSNGELREALITNSAYSEATMGKTIGQRNLAPRPIEPMEPTGKPMTKKERKDFEDYYATHDDFGQKLGYDKRVWNNYYKKNANKYKKKYNNYKKNYYYDSYGNKYYK